MIGVVICSVPRMLPGPSLYQHQPQPRLNDVAFNDTFFGSSLTFCRVVFNNLSYKIHCGRTGSYFDCFGLTWKLFPPVLPLPLSSGPSAAF